LNGAMAFLFCRMENSLAKLSVYSSMAGHRQDRGGTDAYNWGYDPVALHRAGGVRTPPTRTARPGSSSSGRWWRRCTRPGLRVCPRRRPTTNTSASGQDPHSVLDQIVAGYYQRLSAAGLVDDRQLLRGQPRPEHAMMDKLVVDSVSTWAAQVPRSTASASTLMGLDPKQTMLDVQTSLAEADPRQGRASTGQEPLPLRRGLGLRCGVRRNARLRQPPSQANMADNRHRGRSTSRLPRNAVRGGGPFDSDPGIQGFASGPLQPTRTATPVQTAPAADQEGPKLLHAQGPDRGRSHRQPEGIPVHGFDRRHGDRGPGGLQRLPGRIRPPTRPTASRTVDAPRQRDAVRRRCPTSSPPRRTTFPDPSPQLQVSRAWPPRHCHRGPGFPRWRGSRPACAPSRFDGQLVSTRATGSNAIPLGLRRRATAWDLGAAVVGGQPGEVVLRRSRLLHQRRHCGPTARRSTRRAAMYQGPAAGQGGRRPFLSLGTAAAVSGPTSSFPLSGEAGDTWCHHHDALGLPGVDSRLEVGV